MRLIWSPEAQRQLHAIREYWGEQASIERADALMARLQNRARWLLAVPRSGRKVQPENRDDLRVFGERPYWLYYRICADAIEIVTVLHYRQQLPRQAN